MVPPVGPGNPLRLLIIEISEYTKNLSKCLKFSQAYQKMGYPADFSGFAQDLPEHWELHGIIEWRDISVESDIFTTWGPIDSSSCYTSVA